MLPVVAGEDETRRQILIYTVVLVVFSLLLYSIGGMGGLYAVAALVLGVVFLLLAVRLLRDKTERAAVRLFGYSIVYLALLFVAMVADSRLRG